MNDETALLRGCRACPNDNLPRLIYAGWLEEHGQPDRAAYIRIPCELANPTGDATPSQALIQESQHVFSSHHAEWDAPLRSALSTDDVEIVYDRGLPYKVRMPLDVFVARGDSLAMIPTITTLKLKAILESGAQALASSPHLVNLASLNLSVNGIGDGGAQALASSPSFRPEMNIVLLDFNGSFAEFQHWEQMRRLHKSTKTSQSREL